MRKLGLILLMILLISTPSSSIEVVANNQEPNSSMKTNSIISNSDKIQSTQVELQGIVVIDDSHNNDYTAGDMTMVVSELEALGYVVKFTSEFSSFQEAVFSANFLIIPAPFTEITSGEISDIANWFNDGSRNLILASRGDFSEPNYLGMNNLLSTLNATTRTQDDNVYTTAGTAPQPWYIDTNNFNIQNFPSMFDGVNTISYFSPSSLSPGQAGSVLMYAEEQAYQSNENGDPASVIYDDTDDGTGGDTIPLSVYEEVEIGNLTDRIITLGTTLWSDFDYGASSFGDIDFFNNVLEYMRNKTLSEAGEIDINLDDTFPPSVEITFPHNNAILKDTVIIETESSDLFGGVTTTISIDGEIVSNTSTYSWDTTQYTEGAHVVNLTAVDEAGNNNSVIHNYVIDQEHVPQLNNNTKVMTYNIKESGIFDAWLDVLYEENADIIVLVETGGFDDSGNEKLNQLISDMNAYFFDEIAYQGYTLQNINSDFDGITILSRFNIIDNNKLDSLTDDDGNRVNIPLPFLHSIVEIAGENVHIIGAHLTCCPGQENWNQREEQQESVINYMDNLGDEPIIYLGDMNSVSPDDFDPSSQNPADDLGTEPIEMILNPSHPKASNVHTFTDVAREFGTDDVTFIGSILSRIDFVFTNQHFENMLVSSTTGDTASAQIGSDHVSVDVVINIDNGFTYTPSAPVTGEGDDDVNFQFIYVLIGISVITSYKKLRKLKN